MLNLARLSQHPLLAPYFEAVNPFFWPVLIWQLMKMASEVTAAGGREALIHVSWWGGVRIEYIGAEPETSANRSSNPLRKPWSDAGWSSMIPAGLLTSAHALFFPRICGGSGRPRSGLTKGVCALSPITDTS